MGIFNVNATRNITKNKFDLSHEKKLSCKFGELVPVLCQEVIPGDSFRVNTELFVRLAPMLSPIMHRIDVYTHYFYVPNRIVWDGWEDFIRDVEGVSPPEHPHFRWDESFKANFYSSTLADYFGLPVADKNNPPTIVGSELINALPFRAYQSIYNEWYKDESFGTEIDIRKSVDGLDNSTNLTQLRKRAWPKDYFTSARIRAQKGQPVRFNVDRVESVSGNNLSGFNTLTTEAGGSPTATVAENTSNETLNFTGLISDLRRAEAVQQYLERLQRSGNRYKEYLAGIFGINYQAIDSRIDIPEFLGGSKSPVSISEVVNTTGPTDIQAGQPEAGTLAQGNLAGHGIGVGADHGFKGSFPEHGWIIGIMSIIPKAAYQDGLNRKWSRFSKFEYYTPDLANIGEQEVLGKEIYVDRTDLDATFQDDIWGYQQRYAEYKYEHDSVHGDMRFNLNYWHLGREFASAPDLNRFFIECDPVRDNLNRIFNVEDPDEDPFWVQLYHKIDAIRPMYYESIPGLG